MTRLPVVALLAVAAHAHAQAGAIPPDVEAAFIARADAGYKADVEACDMPLRALAGKPVPGLERMANDCRERAARHREIALKDSEVRYLSAKLAQSKREELSEEIRRCVPRGDCNNEYLHGVAQDAVDNAVEARAGRR